MNKAEFHILLKHPENLDKARITELKALLAEFPYFQAGKMLLLKNLHNLKHYEYDKTLRHVSISVPDRVRLFQYIENQIPTTVIPPSTKEVVAEKDETIALTPTNSSEAILDENLTNDLLIETIAESKTELPTAEPILAPDEEAVETVAESQKDTEHDIETKAPLVISINETHSFSEWLTLNKTVIHPILDEKTPDSEKAVLPTSEDEKTTEVVLNKPNSIVEKNDASKSNVKDFESILDKFIRENPRISRPKAEFYNPANMAKQSVEENEDIATETLAKLYVNQGHFKKAIRTYEKLCLIYPHRITYFADLIQKIKTEHKD